jgi:hypothetical protein
MGDDMKHGDLAVGIISIFGLGFLLGLSVAEEKAAVTLQPCPVQMGMKVKNSAVSEGVLTCYYTPEIKGRKI